MGGHNVYVGSGNRSKVPMMRGQFRNKKFLPGRLQIWSCKSSFHRRFSKAPSGKQYIRRLRGARRLRRRRYAYPSIKQEPKWFDVSRTLSSIPIPYANTAGLELDPTAHTGGVATPAMACFNCPLVGDGQNNRDGRKIVVTSLEVKGFVIVPSVGNGVAGALPRPVSIWVALVIDTQTNGVQLNSEDVYVYNNIVNIDGQDSCQPFKNLLFGNRFRTLRMWTMTINDRMTVLENDNTVDSQSVRRPFHYYKKLKLPVDFNAGTSADVANIIDNSIHLIAGASPYLAGGSPQITYSGRIRFIG